MSFPCNGREAHRPFFCLWGARCRAAEMSPECFEWLRGAENGQKRGRGRFLGAKIGVVSQKSRTFEMFLRNAK